MPSSLSQSRRKRGGPVLIAFPARAKLFDLDHRPLSLYLLRAGRVRLAHGREAVVDYLAPGDVFGEKCLLPGGRDDEIATTLTPVRVLAFRRSELPAALQRDPRLARRLLKRLAVRLDRSQETIRDFVVEPTERRLARVLFRFLPARGGSSWVRLRFSPSNSELARTIGSTRWRIAHFMRKFQQLGWLARRRELWVRADGIKEFLHSE
jgi:CRP/FNR family cyclic AMP-dependent transcriptional regulator